MGFIPWLTGHISTYAFNAPEFSAENSGSLKHYWVHVYRCTHIGIKLRPAAAALSRALLCPPSTAEGSSRLPWVPAPSCPGSVGSLNLCRRGTSWLAFLRYGELRGEGSEWGRAQALGAGGIVLALWAAVCQPHRLGPVPIATWLEGSIP